MNSPSSSRYPFRSYPDGWFVLAESRDLGGQELAVRAMGRTTRLRRGADGVVAQGGVITHVREQDGMILGWHHVGGENPTWWIPEGPRDDWSDAVVHTHEVAVHPQEVLENTVDLRHFLTVHAYADITVCNPPSVDGPNFRASYGFTRSEGFLGRLSAPIDVVIRIHASGLGFSRVRVEVPKFGIEALYEVSVTPIDAERSTLRSLTRVKQPRTGSHRIDAATALPRRWLTMLVCRLAARGGASDFAADYKIWKHKIYRHPPLLVEGDGPIGIYRAWAWQFVAPSPVLEFR